MTVSPLTQLSALPRSLVRVPILAIWVVGLLYTYARLW
jgi:hypothetical protein